VVNMGNMFNHATAFNQSLGTWALNATVHLSSMLDNCGMDCANYSATLISWAANPSTPSGRSLGATGRTYETNAASAHSILTNAKGWTIFGDVFAPTSTADAGPDQTGANTCGLTQVTLAANTPTVGTGQWSIQSGTGGSLGNPSSPSSTFAGNAGATYTLRWTVSNAPCAASTDEMVVTFHQNPTPAAAGDDQTSNATCGLTQVTLAANTPSIGTGAWSIQSGTGGSFGNANSPTSTFYGTAGNTYTLRWTVMNSPCAASTDEMAVTFNQNPTPAAACDDQTSNATCGLTQVTLAANTPTVGTGQWSIQSGTGGSLGNPSSPTSTFSGNAGATYTLRWTVSNSPCAASTDEMTVTFNQTPTFSACPPGVTVNATSDCSATATYIATAAATTPAASVTYVFGGATSGSGSGTGSGQSFNLGTTTISLSATSSCGTSSCFLSVTVQAAEINVQGNGTDILDGDNTPSTADHTDFGQTNGPNVVRTFTVQNTGVAPLSVSGITLGGATPGQFSVGPLTPVSPVAANGSATFTVTYAPSAAAVHNATVNIASNDCDAATYNFAVRGELTCTAPTFTACPSNQPPVNASANTCSAAVSYSVAASGSPTPDLTYVLTGATTGSGSGSGSGATFGAGVTTVTVIATNPCGAPTCSFTVTVLDAQNPSIVCPQNISKTTDANQCSAVTIYTSPTFSDNCGGATLTRTEGFASGSAFPKGTTNVAWKATDVAGNSSVCNFTVTVTDSQAPTIACQTNIVKNTDAGLCTAVTTYANPTYSDNCAGAGLDHISGGLSGSTFPKGTTSVIWQTTDAAGLTKRCTFTVTVNDTQLPGITCPANQTIGTVAGQCHGTTTYTVGYSDNCSGGGAAIQSGVPSGGNFPKGINMVTWRATDAAGLTRTCSFRVTVNDTQLPTIACPSSQSLSTDANLCSAVATYTLPTAADNCAPLPTVSKISGLSSGSAFPRGVSAVVWKATDGAGLTKTCSFTVTVTDVQLPALTCPQNISVAGSGSPCTAAVTYTTPTATDNCGVQSVSLLSGLVSGSSFPAGTANIVWRAVDNSGLSTTCSFAVTVNCGASPSGMMNQHDTHHSSFIPDLSGQAIHHLSLNLAPNPATTEVQIFSEKELETSGELRVLDAQGRLMWRQLVEVGQQQWRLDLDDRWQGGLYFVTLQSGGKSVTKRLTVARL